MIIIEDTRNKIGKHRNINRYFERHGIEVIRQKLDVGDYMLPDGNISVDTKEDMLELCSNLMLKRDKARFWREVRRARDTGIKLYILVEERGIYGMSDIARWHNPRSRVPGSALLTEIVRISAAYGVKFMFCDKRRTGRIIYEILTGEVS